MVPRQHRESISSMIFKAAFFIGLVAILMPHEPDVGLGRPDAAAWLPSSASVLSVVGLLRAGNVCSFCARSSVALTAPSLGNGRSLSDIKAEIGAAIKARRNRL